MRRNSRRAIKVGPPMRAAVSVGHHTLLAFGIVAVYGLAPSPARAEIGPVAYSFDTSDNPLPFPYSDFAPGELKAECSSGGPVDGLSATVGGSAHSVLCETPFHDGSSFPFNSTAVTEVFSTSNSAHFGGRGDWDPGYLKGECAVGNVVNGVAQTGGGQIDHLECTHYATGLNNVSTNTACQAHTFPGNYPSPFSYSDWASGDYKLECDPGTTLVGISADVNAHHPHAVLCCSMDQTNGSVAYSFDTSDNPLPFPYSDFAPGELKAECPSGDPVDGLSASPNGKAHSVLCETPSHDQSIFRFNSTAVTETFSTSNSADFGGRGDWDPGYLKGECAVGNVINGVAQTVSGQIDHLECTHNGLDTSALSADTTCQAHTFPGNYPTSFPYSDWASGYYKLECDPGTTMVGISADVNAHNPHAVLCCTLDQTSWTPLVHQPSFVADTALLLTDGTVMVQVRDAVAWYRLTPDAFGNYWTGTWSQLANAPSGYSPASYASAVLPDGRVIIEGGEYLAGQGPVWTNLGALYDPTTNSWTSIAPPSGWAFIGDAESVVLANGTFMLASADPGTSSALFNASTLTWTTTGSGKADSYDEEGWTLLPSGQVLTVDTGNGTNSELYNPSTGTWASAGSTGVGLVDTVHHEIGPGLLLADGRVFVGGATPNTALYGTDGIWRAGPHFPIYAEGQMMMSDACAALLPNGNALLGTSNGDVLGVHFLEFDGANLFEVARTPNAPNTTSEEEKFLILPSGQVLATDVTGDVEIYFPRAPTTAPSWAPAISGVPATVTRGHTYLIQGTRFNGVSQGMAYGDDVQQATNYPLVRITNNATHHVFYARTHGHSTMGVATGNTAVSTNFDVPAAAETGASTVVVVANGVASATKSITVN